MTTPKISALRQRMIDDMTARKMVAGTQIGHVRACKRFTAYLGRSPDTATAEDIRRFQLHLAETGVSICTRNRTSCWKRAGHDDRAAVSVSHNAAAPGSCR